MLIGVDIGGTFTDIVVADGDQILLVDKVLSTPPDFEVGMLQGFDSNQLNMAECRLLSHASTVATNAVLERRGNDTCLLITEGFRDVPIIQRQHKRDPYTFSYRRPESLVPRARILEVHERVAADGSIVCPLQLGDLFDRVKRVVDEGVSSIAICLLHSYKNPQHEHELARMIRERFPSVWVTESSEISPQFREYERASTAIIAAYVRPGIERYVRKLLQGLDARSFGGRLVLIQGNGGWVPGEEIGQYAPRMILSGPAAGVIGATAMSAPAGYRNLITFDMGGTSTDVSLVNNGEAAFSTELEVGNLPLQFPVVDIVSVGAGGGSIAHSVGGKVLNVGPQSAGANPGPASHGHGGSNFTVSDANLLLGYLRPEGLAGGKVRLHIEKARQAARPLAEALGMSEQELAAGVRQVVNFNMAQAIRLVTVERGYDPREYTLVAGGGGGPLHAAEVAEAIGIETVLVPAHPGLMSAVGLLYAPVKVDHVRTRVARLSGITADAIRTLFLEMADEATKEIAHFRVPMDRIETEYLLDLRYPGQAYELMVPIPDLHDETLSTSNLREAFRRAHTRRYGHFPELPDVEIVNFRVIVSEPIRTLKLTRSDGQARGMPRPIVRQMLLDIHVDDVCFFRRVELPQGGVVAGPAMIEELSTTTAVPRGWNAQVDEYENLVLRRR